MNCYNGSEYLNEAIDSVFAQTYKNWEIIFIDNCSTDESAKIAMYYGEKVRYFATDNNIPLGAARNFGIQFCDGDYISFLDCDDVWFPDMLEKQVAAIDSGDYALAYAGQINIDERGDQVGEIIPKFKNGNIFGELLLQYDVPLVTAIIKKEKLIESKLNFDLNVKGSEEYCLFMQLAIRYNFIVIPEALVRYRVLGNSLTSKTISVRGAERKYTLDKIIDTYPKVNNQYPDALKEAYARGVYYDAQYSAFIGDKLLARKLMKSIKGIQSRYYLLYLILFFPLPIWHLLQKNKYGR
jgi:glycosyltransferase involved in cell wall biosynthesis